MAQGLPPHIQQAMDDQAKEFAQYLYDKMSKVLSRKTFRNTDELLQSLETSWTQSSENDLPVIHMRFAIHGKFIDIKKLYWTQLPPVQEMISWLEGANVDLARFSRIPGYKEGRAPFSRQKAIERIAWAVAWKKKFTFKSKQKKWKQDNLGIAVKYLTHLVAENFAQYAADAVANTINRKITQNA